MMDGYHHLSTPSKALTLGALACSLTAMSADTQKAVATAMTWGPFCQRCASELASFLLLMLKGWFVWESFKGDHFSTVKFPMNFSARFCNWDAQPWAVRAVVMVSTRDAVSPVVDRCGSVAPRGGREVVWFFITEIICGGF